MIVAWQYVIWAPVAVALLHGKMKSAMLGTSESARRRCGVYIGDSPDVLKHNLVLSL